MIDPKLATLYPEEHVDAQVVMSIEGGVQVSLYSSFSPYMIRLRSLATSRNPNTIVRVSVDGAAEVIRAATLARFDYDIPEEVDLPALKTLAVTLTSDVGSGNILGQIVRHSLAITRPTVYEKVKYGLSLNEEERELDVQFGISEKINSGVLRALDNQQFLQIKEIAVRMNAAANANPILWRDLQATTGKKVILLGITADAPLAANTVFVRVDRDATNNLQRYDTFALPTVSQEQRCYIPAIDKIRLTLVNTVAVVNQLVRYRYAIAKITLVDKLRWGLSLDDTEQAIIDNLDLGNVVKAGVM